MAPKTLAEIKRQLGKFYNVYRKVADHFNGEHETHPHLTAICVLLQNIAADTSNCTDHNHEAEVKELTKVENLLDEIATYSDSYMERWAYKEVSMIIRGVKMSEEYEDIFNDPEDPDWADEWDDALEDEEDRIGREYHENGND